jgi:hypothetical protein
MYKSPVFRQIARKKAICVNYFIAALVQLPIHQSVDMWHETGKQIGVRNARTHVDNKEKPDPNMNETWDEE